MNVDCSMGALSQIVGQDARPLTNMLCVAGDLPTWQIVAMESDDKNGGPNNLKAWREFVGMSQAELAAKVEPPTSVNMIQYLESGERGLSLKWLRRLADALGTTSGRLADFNPSQVNLEALAYFASKSKDEQTQILRIARALTGTEDE